MLYITQSARNYVLMNFRKREKGMDEKHGKSDAEMEELRETLPAEPPVYGDPVTDSGVCLRL